MSCVCCTAIERKASAVNALLVLLFMLSEIPAARVIDALCAKHGARLDSMIYRSLAPKIAVHAKPKLRRLGFWRPPTEETKP